ncbi:MAG: PAS domain S-box protein [Desulfobacterales bacterium]|nr:PAS domain S-box protein [Desulfobacterales bacterium]
MAYNESSFKNKKVFGKVEHAQKKMKKWVEYAPMNYLHKYFLLEAEIARVKGKDEMAVFLYDKAIKASRESGYIQEEALSYELAGKFYMEKGSDDIAEIYISKAISCYTKWGAFSKVKELETKYSQSIYKPLADEFKNAAKVGGHTISTTEGTSETIDISTVMKASQAISGEIILEKLLGNMIKIVIENAGAQKGILILYKAGKLVIEAMSEMDKKISVLQSIPIDISNNLCTSIVYYVERTKETIVINDAENEGMFTANPYILANKPKSILCLPVMNQGILTGILYLENNLTKGAFTKDRIELLRILCSQISVSIENARLYNDLKDKNINLQKAEEKYRSIFENALEGIFQASHYGYFINSNPAMAKILGYDSPQELVLNQINIGEHCFATPDDFNRFIHLLNKKGRITEYETQGLRKNKTIFWGLMAIRIISDVNGKVLYYEGSIADITERKQKEESERERQIAEKANKHLKEMERKKTDFLSSVSHELRTPLTSILGFAKLIHKDFNKFFKPKSGETGIVLKKADKISENLEVIIREGDRLTRMINDILDVVKIESGNVVWRDSVLFFSDIVRHAVQAVSGAFALKNEVKLISSIQDDSIQIKADRDKLEQVIINLLNNAFKFTEKGEVEVILEKDKENNYAKVTVKDTGMGIPTGELEKVFDKFHQVVKENTLVDKPKGTGLGLSICKQIIEYYDGKIWVESELGKGSSFIFVIPLLLSYE